MSLDVSNFDLFAKKTKAAPLPLKPIAKPVVEVAPEAIETPVLEATPQEVLPQVEAVIETFERKIEEPSRETKPLKDLLTATFQTNQNFAEEKREDSFTLREESKAKYESFLPITSRVREEDVQTLKKIENTIMRGRRKGGGESRERITTNSILRCVIANFLERANDLDLTNIENEAELKIRLDKAFKQKYTKRTLDQ